jgi:hypothetical protein
MTGAFTAAVSHGDGYRDRSISATLSDDRVSNKAKVDWMMLRSIRLIALLCLCGCATTSPQWRERTDPIVSVSARGWTIKPGRSEDGSGWRTTVIVNPKGEEFNIGVTQYPDFLPATLWIVEVKQLDARFLLIRVPPAASAAVDMPILYLDRNDKPSLAGRIGQRFEFQANPHDRPGFDTIIERDGRHRLRDILFEDSDGDGVPELVESDFWQADGTVTYYRFTDRKTFTPVWEEKWRLGEHGFERISRTRVVETDAQPDAGHP